MTMKINKDHSFITLCGSLCCAVAVSRPLEQFVFIWPDLAFAGNPVF